jgi:pyruvate/2-oxoglutarate dehydrogenase complex dihydrolipoamide dehydrogenase (E3) component
MFQLAIVGLGPAGIFTLASLPEDMLPETLILERSCIGGDLSSQYGSVIANITKTHFINIFKMFPKWANQTFPELDAYEINDAPKLADICKILRRLAKPDIQKAHLHTTALSNLVQTTDGWNLVTPKETYQAKHVILCLGATPKTMDLPLPSIPLPIALAQDQLTHVVAPTDIIVVFGTSHSGTLILNNLKQLGCRNVYAVYRGKTPVQEGLKLAASTIAQEIQSKQWGDLTPTFINYDDFSKIYRILSKANAVIYAIGFEPRSFTYTNKDGTCVPLTNDTPGVYGFGIGRPRPSVGNDGIGFEEFIKAIQAELPGILSA